MVKNDFNDTDGVWRTVGGRRIFIRTGQSLSDAMKKSGKFKSTKKKNEIKDENKKISNDELKKDYEKKLKEWINSPVDDEEEKIKREKAKNEAYYKLNGRPARNMQESLAKKELNLSQKQIDEGNRLNNKAENGVRDDFKQYLRGKEFYDGEPKDLAKELSNEWGIDLKRTEEILNEETQKYLHQGKSIEANKSPGQKTADLIKESGVKTFADEIKNKEKISSEEFNKKMDTEYSRLKNREIDTKEYFKRTDDIENKYTTDKKIKGNEPNTKMKTPYKGSNEKYTIDYFKEKGVDIKDKAPEGWQKLEGATTAPNGYEWYSNGKSRFGGEYKNALVKKENTSSSIDNTIRRKAYQKYLKEHPNSKLTFEAFKDMNKMK